MFDRRWPGFPRACVNNLNKMADSIEASMRWRSDGTVQVRRGPHSMFATVPAPTGFFAIITDGSNPYSWRKITPTDGGKHDVMFTGAANMYGNSSTRPAYERSGNRDVLPGTCVWMEELPVTTDATIINFVFDLKEGPIAAEVTTAGAPTTDLNGAILVTATSLTVDSAASFPGRNGFYVQIDDEVLQVTAGAGTVNWTVTRAQFDTEAWSHADEAIVTLVGVYAWTEQSPVEEGGWQTRSGGLAGTQVVQPAFERNGAVNVPDNTFVVMRRRYSLGSGSSTITADVQPADVTIPITDRTSFPQVVPFHVLMNGEFMEVTAGAGSGAGSFTVVRGRYLPPPGFPTRHASGDAVEEAATEWVFEYEADRGLTVQDTRLCTMLTASIDITGTTVSIASGAEFPNTTPFDVVCEGEQMTVTAGGGTLTWTVTRGANGTVAKQHNQWARICRLLSPLTTTLNGNISSSVTQLTVTSADLFPQYDRFVIQIGSEKMLVNGVSGTLFAVARGYDGTTAASHSNGDTVRLFLPGQTLNHIERIVYEDTSFVSPGGPNRKWAVITEPVQVLELVSGPDGNGLYDAYVLKQDPTTGTWYRDIRVWAEDVNA